VIPKIKIIVDKTGIDGFFRRTLAHARALDRGDRTPNDSIIAFESASDMLRVFNSERVRLIETLRTTGPVSITILAETPGRNKRAVSRDVAAMRQACVLKTELVSNAGNGRQLIVMPAARRVELKSTL
jgi:predicted transcriptional regulator